ncbi:MAG: TonB-dependent receptor [Bacteroidetes bacterium]|nr:TonB-dependent receptor [Bacteroidota bacterium]
MKKIILFIIYVFIVDVTLALTTVNSAKTFLSGTVTDSATGEPLAGAVIYLPDLKTGAASGVDGTYKIENLPRIKTLVQVSLIGYKSIVENINLAESTVRDFVLEASIKEMHEVVVTGLSQAAERTRTPTPISLVSKTQLLQNASTNIIDAIAAQPGVSQLTTGAGISKPVIRGLGYNRVVVVNDGIRQEGNQWGDEHGIEIDELSVNRVEILKGPASLAYGSDAMAGVVNMMSAPTLPNGKIEGSITVNYQTNNGLISHSGNVAGNINGFIWDLRYTNKQAHAYKNKYDGYVFNSGFTENNFSGMTGLNRSWGYSHLHFSIYDFMPGVVEGARDSATGRFVKSIALNDTTEGTQLVSPAEMKSYAPFTPYQKIKHYKAALNNNFIIGRGNLKLTLGFQQNHRQEYADIFKPGQYGLFFLLNTFNYDVRYVLPEKNNFHISFGLNGMQQTSQNKGSEYLVPEYDLFDAGLFALAKKSFDKLDVSGGIRFDSRGQRGKELYLNSKDEKVEVPDTGSIQRFAKFNTGFRGFSGSIGATYQFSEYVYTKLNFSRGYRAPNIGEIGANGIHDGTIRYEIGDPKLNSESSLQVDYALGFNTKHISAELDLFTNTINNFTFLRKLSSVSGGDSISEGFSTFKFVQGNAGLLGGEIVIDVHPHPLDWLHFENSFSYVQAVQSGQTDSTKYLPFTPAPKLQSDLRADLRKAGEFFGNAYIKLGVDHYFTQDKIYSAYNTETKTPGYTLVNLGAGADVIVKDKTVVSFYISVNNLTDIGYQSHLNRLKYSDLNYTTGRTGVYNMGRNISFKVVVPFKIKK